MLYEDRKKEIETIKERTLVLKLSDADCDRILQKAASHGMTVSGLLESFIGDLVDFLHSQQQERGQSATLGLATAQAHLPHLTEVLPPCIMRVWEIYCKLPKVLPL